MDKEAKPEDAKSKRQARDNPWYRLAILHGESFDEDVAAKNRLTWNRWIASLISDVEKTSLTRTERCSIEQVAPFSMDEQKDILASVGVSSLSGNIDFSDTEFNGSFVAEGFLFHSTDFSGATFGTHTNFIGATFSRNTNFGGATFSGVAGFGNVEFRGPSNFSGATFKSNANFSGATFRSVADFQRATFSGYVAYCSAADFSGARFHHTTNFSSATFASKVNFGAAADFNSATFGAYTTDFSGATFEGYAKFHDANFKAADFCSAKFRGAAGFNSASFSAPAGSGGGAADFRWAAFRGDAEFHSAKFFGIRGADFRSAAFRGAADFSKAKFNGNATFAGTKFGGNTTFLIVKFSGAADFINAEMKGKTKFDYVEFSAPPECFNAKLHEGTTWHGVDWPKTPKDVGRARDFEDAYERLKLEMDRLKRHSDELDFFARELRCRRVAEGRWRGLPISVYGFLCNYGRSYARPFSLLIATVLFGALFPTIYLSGCRFPYPPTCRSLLLLELKQNLGISFASTLGVFGRPLINPDVLLRLPDWLKAVGTIQAILGIVFLFLFGLGIRNAFRLK